MSENLVRVFGARNDGSGMVWLFYDPRPEFEDANTLMEFKQGEAYEILVNEATTVTLGAHTYTLFPGWNLITWFG